MAHMQMADLNATVRLADLHAYEGVTDLVNGPAMTWAMHAIGHLDADQPAKAAALFNRSFAERVHPPFAAWSELPLSVRGGGAVPFLTGSGGFLQAVLYGYAGVRLRERCMLVRPQLIEGAASMAIRGVHYQGHALDMVYNAHTLTVALVDGERSSREPGRGLSISRGSPDCKLSPDSAGTQQLRRAGDRARFVLLGHAGSASLAGSQSWTFVVQVRPGE